MEVTIKKYGRTWIAYTYGPPWFHIEGKTKGEVTKKQKPQFNFIVSIFSVKSPQSKIENYFGILPK